MLHPWYRLQQNSFQEISDTKLCLLIPPHLSSHISNHSTAQAEQNTQRRMTLTRYTLTAELITLCIGQHAATTAKWIWWMDNSHRTSIAYTATTAENISQIWCGNENNNLAQLNGAPKMGICSYWITFGQCARSTRWFFFRIFFFIFLISFSANAAQKRSDQNVFLSYEVFVEPCCWILETRHIAVASISITNWGCIENFLFCSSHFCVILCRCHRRIM